MTTLPSSRIPDPIDAPAIRWGVLAPGGIARDWTAALHATDGVAGGGGRLALARAGAGLRRRVRGRARLRQLRGPGRRPGGRRRSTSPARTPQHHDHALLALERRQAGAGGEGVHPQRPRGDGGHRGCPRTRAARRRGDVDALPAAPRRRTPVPRGRAARRGRTPSRPTTASCSTPTARSAWPTRRSPAARCSTWGSTRSPSPTSHSAAFTAVQATGTLIETGVDAERDDRGHRAPGRDRHALVDDARQDPLRGVDLRHRGAARDRRLVLPAEHRAPARPRRPRARPLRVTEPRARAGLRGRRVRPAAERRAGRSPTCSRWTRRCGSCRCSTRCARSSACASRARTEARRSSRCRPTSHPVSACGAPRPGTEVVTRRLQET